MTTAPAGSAAFQPQPDGRGRLSVAVRVGLILFGLGVIAVLIDVIPFFLGVRDRPLWLNLCCLLVPIGLLIAVGAALARGRAEQKQALRAAERLAARR